MGPDGLIPDHTQYIELSGDAAVTAKALVILAARRCPVFVIYKQRTVLHNAVGSRLKKIQVRANPAQVGKRMTRIRNKHARLLGLPEIKWDKQSPLIQEARDMKAVYRTAAAQAGITWAGKAATCSMRGTHSWWTVLYREIETCALRMGLDLDIGYIHQDKRALVYDIADTLKPLFLAESLKVQPYEFRRFFELWKFYRLKRRLPLLILYFLRGTHPKCSLPRLRPYHE